MMGRDFNDFAADKTDEEIRAAIDGTPPYTPNGADKERGNGRAGAGSADEKSGRIYLVPFSDIKLGNSRRDLVKGLIPRIGLVVVWGPPKSGKSFLTFDLTMHVALGWEYRGRRVTGGPVVYCAFEGQTGIEARVEAFRQRFLAESKGALIPFYLEPVTLDLVGDRTELIEVIRRQLRDHAPVVVVLDTLNRSLRGSESNDEDMSAFVTAADAIREAFKCVVIIVHHCGVDGTRPRGHTSLSGAVDAQLSVKRDTSDNIVLTVELAKDGPQGESITSRLEVVDVGLDEDGEKITSCVVVPVDGAAPARKTVKLAPTPRAGLDNLNRCLCDLGRPAPVSNHIPAAVQTVTLTEWKDQLLNTGIINPEGSHREQFRRIRVTLQNARLIGVWNEYVWTVT